MSPRSQDQVTFRTCRAIFEAFEPFTITRLSQVSENEWLELLTKTGHGMSKVSLFLNDLYKFTIRNMQNNWFHASNQ